MRKAVAIGILLLTASACDRAEGEASQAAPSHDGLRTGSASADLNGFRHELSIDPSGFFMPVSEARAGVWRLNHIAVSDRGALAAWEAGGRSETYAPIMFQFDDATSPERVDESGRTFSAVTARVLPDAYEITDQRVRFRGRAPGIGPVTFDGVLDADGVETAQRRLGGIEAAALTGTLTVNGQVFQNQSFTWWMGD